MPVFELFNNDSGAKSFRSGETIFFEGDPGDAMYAVIEGEVEIRKGGDHLLEVVGRGGVFGEMALIDSEPRSAGAVARTDCRVVPISERRFMTMVQQTPFFALQLMQVLTERLRNNTNC